MPPQRKLTPTHIASLAVCLLVMGILIARGRWQPAVPAPIRDASSTNPQPFSTLVGERLKQMEAPLRVLSEAPHAEPSAVPLYIASGLRDPLQPLLPPEPVTPAYDASANNTTASAPALSAPPTFVIQGLFLGGDRPTAIINGEVRTVGDTIMGATITGIDRRGIAVEFQGAAYLTTVKGTTTMLSHDVSWR